MDPTQQLNALRQYMDFYYHNLMTPNRAMAGTAGFSGGVMDNSIGQGNSALSFAQGMMGGGMNGGMNGNQPPDFFGGQTLPQYSAPQQFQQPQAQPQERAPLRDDMTNHLRTLMQNRGGY